MKKLVLLMVALFAFSAQAKTIEPWELEQMNGEKGTYRSLDYGNGVFLVEAYFLGCPYCNDNAPNVDEIAERYADNTNVQVLDVGVDRSNSQYDTWIRRHNPNHPVLKDANKTLIRQLGTRGYPSAYVINCRYEVVYQTSGVWNATKKRAIQEAIDAQLEDPCYL